MFYQILNTLKRYNIPQIAINNLDAWLGTRRKAVYYSLNPLQFSIDTDLDEDYSLYLFSLCTMKEIQLLKTRYSVICPVCDNYLKSYYDISEIDNSFVCHECETDLLIKDEYIEISFELLREPDIYPYNREEIEKIRGPISGKKRVAFAYQQ